ncbi:hypothetical protein WJ72_03660 [Burkholderia ubonensis]|nr:hypothetical protein WJ72_03660 [Burkholderia ubonensis]
MAGYSPIASRSSFPAILYLYRQSLEPDGRTSRYSPLVSVSLVGLVPVFAYRILTSVSGTMKKRVSLLEV